ncbi:MAG: hypothetical protein JWP35_2279 [Caulobacter sp.]|nr:hypothetical protein [Caulobacter sp.]
MTRDEDPIEATQETRAASTGARPLAAFATAAALILHLAPPLAALTERAGLGAAVYHALPAKAANLWLRLGPARLQGGLEHIVLGLLVAGLLLYGLSQTGRRLRISVQMFAAAVLLNDFDWMVLSHPAIIRNPLLTADERLAALVLMLVEVALAALLWLRVRPPSHGPRGSDDPK